MKIMIKNIFIFICLSISSVHAYLPSEELTGDETLSCQILLCMSSADQPKECSPIMAKYFEKLLPKHPFDNPENRMRKFLALCPTGDFGATASYISNCSGAVLIDQLNSPNQNGELPADVPDQCKQPLPGSDEYPLPPEAEEVTPEIEPYSIDLPVHAVHWEIVCDTKDHKGKCKSKQYWELMHEWLYIEDIESNQTVIYDPNTGERYPIPDYP